MSKVIAKIWLFESSSSDKRHETILYTDGTTSCGCMGWTRRVAADGSRSCKHTRLVDMGQADAECVSSKDYEEKKNLNPVKIKAPKPKQAKKVYEEPKSSTPVVRKIQW